jgi:hypothetical protein
MIPICAGYHHWDKFLFSFYFEAKNKTALILPKVRQGSTKKPHKGAFLD